MIWGINTFNIAITVWLAINKRILKCAYQLCSYCVLPLWAFAGQKHTAWPASQGSCPQCLVWRGGRRESGMVVGSGDSRRTPGPCRSPQLQLRHFSIHRVSGSLLQCVYSACSNFYCDFLLFFSGGAVPLSIHPLSLHCDPLRGREPHLHWQPGQCCSRWVTCILLQTPEHRCLPFLILVVIKSQFSTNTRYTLYDIMSSK